MKQPKTLAERQSELQASIAKIEAERDKGVRDLERQLAVARTQGANEVAQLRAAERAEHAEICRNLAREETSLLLTSAYHALKDFRPAEIEVLAGHYHSANQRSLDLAGYDLLATGRLAFIAAEVRALQGGRFELGTQRGLPVGGVVAYSPSGRTFEASLIDWLPSHLLVAQPLQRLHMQLMGRNRHAAAEALRDLEQGIDQLLRTGHVGDDWDLDARWRALRLSGGPAQIFDAMQAVRNAEQAPSKAERERRTEIADARYTMTQRLANGLTTVRDAMSQLAARFGDDAGPALASPYHNLVVATDAAPGPRWREDGTDSLRLQVEVDTTTGTRTTMGTDDALPAAQPLGPEGHPAHLLSKDGWPVTEWVHL